MDMPHIDCAGQSERGKVRESNEDRFLIANLCKSLRIAQTNLEHGHRDRLVENDPGKLLVVADGMGGQAAGDRASAVAVRGILHYTLNCMRWFFRLSDDPENDFLDDLRAAVEHSQSRVLADAKSDPDRAGMGTTLTAAYVVWPRLYVVHVGDTRAYLLRNAKLHQITRDHTVAQKMVDEGAMDEEEAENTRFSHMLWNFVGSSEKDFRPEVYKAKLACGDAVLLCSDGLTKHVEDSEIARVIGDCELADDACSQFIDMANNAGGKDNITVVLARFLHGPTPNL
jgi:protein phosphatase